MRNQSCLARSLLALLTMGICTTPVLAQSTAFTYQGRLNSAAGPATGWYDLQFTLYATNFAGAACATPVTNNAVAVTNGLFTTTVDFGEAAGNGSNYWLELAVRATGSTGFVTLAPRQMLTPVPSAIYAATAGSLPVAGLVGTIPLAQLPGSVATNGPGGTLPLSEMPPGLTASLASGSGSGLISSNSFGFLDSQQYGGYATVPPVCYNTWNSWYTGYNSNGFASDLAFLRQSAPVLQYYNQQGFALSIDDGLFATRVNGVLQINTNNFPWPAQQLVYMAHTNGIKILCYMEPNGTGTGGTSAGYPDSEGTNIEWDAQQFANMGFDGLKIDPHGWNTTSQEILACQRAEAAFRLAASNRSAIFLHDDEFFEHQYGVQPTVSEIANAFPGTIVRLRSEFSDGGSAQASWGFYLVNYIDALVGLQALNKPGQWIIPVETPTDDWTGNQDTPVMQRMIELSAAEFGGPVLFDQFYGVSAASLAMMTNTEILDVAYDPLWLIGQPVPNVGGSNSFEVFVKTLNDPFGGKEVFLLNRSTYLNESAGFSWPNIGYSPNRQILVRDTQAQTNFGVYSNSFTLNLGPMQCYLLRFEPVDNPILDYLISALGNPGTGKTGGVVASSATPWPQGNSANSIPAANLSNVSAPGTPTAMSVTINPNGSQRLTVDGLDSAGLQRLMQEVANLTNNLLLPPQAICPLTITNGASGLWNSNGLSTWLRTSQPGSTNTVDHLLSAH